MNKIIRWLLIGLGLGVISSCTSDGPIDKSIDDPRKLSEMYVEMGVRYMQFGKLNVALEKLEKAVDIDDSNANAHNSLAVFYEKIKEHDKAEDHFQEAVSLKPEGATSMNNYGRFLCNSGNTDQGITILKKAADLPLNERPWFALTNIGKCEYNRGNSEAAEPYFRQALIKYPGYAPALLSMAEISYEKSEFMKTRAFLERFLSFRQANPDALVLGFLAEQALGHEQKAEEYKSQLLQQYPLSEQAKKIKQMDALKPKQKQIPSQLIETAPES